MHYGAKQTPRLTAGLMFRADRGINRYRMGLEYAAPDRLIFGDETVAFHAPQRIAPQELDLGVGHRETGLTVLAEEDQTVRVMLHLLRQCRVHHFHDTSPTAKVRTTGYVEDNRYLRSDAGNLAACLFGLRNSRPRHYRRILGTLRQVFPFFLDFELEPPAGNDSYVQLNWRSRREDYLLGPHQLSDGFLRFVALATLLMQPEEKLPDVILIDEPELGLHPAAIQILAALLKHAASRVQVLVTTQSVTLVNECDAEDILVAQWEDGESRFHRPDPDGLAEWLEEYSLGELWLKNVIGGRPS